MKTFSHLVVISAAALAILVPRAGAEFAKADKEFLLQQCQIFDDDLGTVAKLPPEVQAQFAAWVAARDSRAFTAFKNTRNYCKFTLKLTNPTETMSFARPPTGWNELYLLPEEIARHRKIVAEHPPCKEVWPDPPVDQLTAAQKEILRSQCNILPEDIEMIKLFSRQTQDNIVRWLTKNDLKKLVPLKVSRDYYRKLLEKPGKVPMPPGNWHYDYLTPEEFCNYSNILDNAPW